MALSSTGSTGNARRLLLLLGALAACGPLSVDMYLPSLPSMAHGFSVTEAVAQLTLTAFMIGFSVGMLLYGPLSDAFGRRPVLLMGVVIYAIASLGCVIAPTIYSLAAMRFVQALGAGAAAVLARAIARDAHAPSEAAKVLSFLAIVTSIGPLMAPLIGGQLLLVGGWRSIFALLTCYGAISAVLVFYRIPETWPREKRAKSALGSSFFAYGRLITDPTAIGHLLCGGMSFASMFVYISATPFVYINFYHVAPQHYGFLFAINIVGLVAGNFINAKLVGRVGTLKMISWSSGTSVVAALATSVVCFTGIGGLPALAFTLFFVVSTVGLLGANCATDLMHRYPKNAGAAAALFGATQFGLGAVSGTVYGLLADGTPRAMGGVILACGVACYLGRTLLIRTHTRAPRL